MEGGGIEDINKSVGSVGDESEYSVSSGGDSVH